MGIFWKQTKISEDFGCLGWKKHLSFPDDSVKISRKNHHTSTSSRLSPMWVSMILKVVCFKEDATSFFLLPFGRFFFLLPTFESPAFQVRFYLLVDSLELTFWGALTKWRIHMNFGHWCWDFGKKFEKIGEPIWRRKTLFYFKQEHQKR